MTFFPWDEINALEEKARKAKEEAANGSPEKATKELIDSVTDLFEMDYFYGVEDVSMQLGVSIDPDFREVSDAINKKIDGKDYIQRINEYMANGTAADIARVIGTDAHRIYNQAMFDAALRGGANTKQWHCMMLPTSRDTHIYLDGVTVPIDAEFYNYKGESTMYPGQWGIAEEDCNCLCWVTFSKL